MYGEGMFDPRPIRFSLHDLYMSPVYIVGAIILCFVLFGGWIGVMPALLTYLFGAAIIMKPLGILIGIGLTVFSWMVVMSL